MKFSVKGEETRRTVCKSSSHFRWSRIRVGCFYIPVKSTQSSFQDDLNSNQGLAANFKVWSLHKATWRKSEQVFPLLCKQPQSETACKSRSLYFWKSSALLGNSKLDVQLVSLLSQEVSPTDPLTQRWLPTVCLKIGMLFKVIRDC